MCSGCSDYYEGDEEESGELFSARREQQEDHWPAPEREAGRPGGPEVAPGGGRNRGKQGVNRWGERLGSGKSMKFWSVRTASSSGAESQQIAVFSAQKLRQRGASTFEVGVPIVIRQTENLNGCSAGGAPPTTCPLCSGR